MDILPPPTRWERIVTWMLTLLIVIALGFAELFALDEDEAEVEL
jgi:hypothetical protein